MEIEGVIVFFIFLSVVFGILSIILFFKIWGMADNVQRMSRRKPEYLLEEAKIESLLENKDAVKKLVDRAFCIEVLSETGNGFVFVEKRYTEIYKKFDIEPVDFDRYKKS